MNQKQAKRQNTTKETNPPTHSEDTKRSSQLDSYVAEMSELPDREFKIAIINRLRDLKEKVDNIREQIGNVSRELEALRNSQMNAQNQNTVTEIPIFIQ